MRLAKHPEIQEALARARDKKARIRAEATKLAIERSAITMERVAVELGRIGFANMMDYMRVGQGGNPMHRLLQPDARASRGDHGAACQ